MGMTAHPCPRRFPLPSLRRVALSWRGHAVVVVERWCGCRVVGDNELTSIVLLVLLLLLVKPIVTTRHPLHGCGFVTGHDLVTCTCTHDPSRGLSCGLSQPVPFPRPRVLPHRLECHPRWLWLSLIVPVDGNHQVTWDQFPVNDMRKDTVYHFHSTVDSQSPCGIKHQMVKLCSL